MMKYLLLATTILAVNAFHVQAASITVTSKTKEIAKNEEQTQLSGEVIDIRPNQATKGDIKPSSAIQDNRVTVNGGTLPIKDKIFGADSVNSDVQNNVVTLNKGNYMQDVFGSQSYNKDAIFNTVNIDGIASFGTVFGGVSYHGDANNNTVKITDSTMTKRVIGGQSNNKNASNNKVELFGTKVNESVYGGFSYAGDATNNTLTVKDSAASDKIYGGFSRDSICKDNKLVIDNSNTMDIVYGGASTTGTVTGNELTILSGKIVGDVYGGYSDFGNVSDNTLRIKSGQFNRNIYDGYSQNGKVENNRIVIEGGDFIRTASIVANFITLSNAPNFNSSLVISGRCDDKSPDGTECLIKFNNFKGAPFRSITKAKKVEIDADSTVALLENGPVKIDGDMDISGTFGFARSGGSNQPHVLIVKDLNADNANFILSSTDYISVSGAAKGTATVDVRFPTGNKIPKYFRVFEGDTSLLDYNLKNEYVIMQNSWHSIHIEKNKDQPNIVNVVSPKTLYADGNSLAIPIEIRQDTVDKIEVMGNGDINTTNGTANLINAKEMSVEDGTLFLDYNDYFRLGKAPKVKNGNLVFNVGSATKPGKYKIFVDNAGQTIKTNAFSVSFTEQNSAFNYNFKDGILEISQRPQP